MTREEFIKLLDEIGAIYEESDVKGYDGIYICSREEYELRKKHPRKYKDLYVPYIRVSHFDEDQLYVKDNGWCCYRSIDKIIEQVKEYAA